MFAILGGLLRDAGRETALQIWRRNAASLSIQIRQPKSILCLLPSQHLYSENRQQVKTLLRSLPYVMKHLEQIHARKLKAVPILFKTLVKLMDAVLLSISPANMRPHPNPLISRTMNHRSGYDRLTKAASRITASSVGDHRIDFALKRIQRRLASRAWYGQRCPSSDAWLRPRVAFA